MTGLQVLAGAVPGAFDGAVGHSAPSLVESSVLRDMIAVRRRIRERQRLPLARTVADQIVPLLVLAHRLPAGPVTRGLAHPHQAVSYAPRPDQARLAASIFPLAGLALANDLNGAVSLIDALHEAGHTLETIYTDVIAGAARHLGQLWHADRASFADITIGVLMLQRLLHALEHAFCGEQVRRDPERRMLLVPRPGESHSFAVNLVAAFLRRAGWEVTCLAPRTEGALCDLLGSGWYAVLGISDSCGDGVEALGSHIRAARRASRNRWLRVMVGGPLFAADPELSIRVGADATAVDARHAVTQAEGLFAMARRDA